MFRKKQQQYTRDEFVRYFSGRLLDQRISEIVHDSIRKVAKVQFISPLEDLHEHHGIADSDLDELLQSILAALGLPSATSDHLSARPDVRTIEGLVLIVDFAFRLERAATS